MGTPLAAPPRAGNRVLAEAKVIKGVVAGKVAKDNQAKPKC